MLLDPLARSWLLNVVEKCVMNIVLDENGLTNFSDAFKMSVDDLIRQLAHMDHLQKENEKLVSVITFQESEIANVRNIEHSNRQKFINEVEKELAVHRDELRFINETLGSVLSDKSPRSSKAYLSAVYKSQENLPVIECNEVDINRYDSVTTMNNE